MLMAIFNGRVRPSTARGLAGMMRVAWIKRDCVVKAAWGGSCGDVWITGGVWIMWGHVDHAGSRA
ncbi:MAG: hypothetical protein ACE5EX_07155 [Phycisphaerae bacterium]